MHKYLQYCIVIFITLSLLFGCAAEFPILSKQSQTSHATHGRKRAYNRPYRVNGKTFYPMDSAEGYIETGIASWYGPESGNTTSMGQRFLPDGYSAAHRTLPLPSQVRVTNLVNGKSVIVVVNDRGPFKLDRLIDLSRGAAKKIGLNGVSKVKVEYLGISNP